MSDLTPSELDKVRSILKREPNETEIGIFTVMWSEHCSYKSSRIHLKKLPTKGDRVLVGPGENAGIIDIGDGYAIAFKIESHNHPSFIEPFQGAATGVGGAGTSSNRSDCSRASNLARAAWAGAASRAGRHHGDGGDRARWRGCGA